TGYAGPNPRQALVDESHQGKRAVVVNPNLIVRRDVQRIAVINDWNDVVVGDGISERERALAIRVETPEAGLSRSVYALVVVTDPNLRARRRLDLVDAFTESNLANQGSIRQEALECRRRALLGIARASS